MAVSALTARAPAVFPASTTAFAPLPPNRVFYAPISTITYATSPVKATNFGWLLAASPVRTSDPCIIQGKVKLFHYDSHYAILLLLQILTNAPLMVLACTTQL